MPATLDPVMSVLRATRRAIKKSGIPVNTPVEKNYSHPPARFAWGVWWRMHEALRTEFDDGMNDWPAYGASYWFAKACGQDDLLSWEPEPKQARKAALQFLDRAIEMLEESR